MNKNKITSEKIEDTIDNVMGTIEDITMGEAHDINSDIPATYQTGNGRRKVSKVLTKRNISRRIMKGKGKWIFFSILAIGGLIALIYYLINLALLA